MKHGPLVIEATALPTGHNHCPYLPLFKTANFLLEFSYLYKNILFYIIWTSLNLSSCLSYFWGHLRLPIFINHRLTTFFSLNLIYFLFFFSLFLSLSYTFSFFFLTLSLSFWVSLFALSLIVLYYLSVIYFGTHSLAIFLPSSLYSFSSAEMHLYLSTYLSM